MGDVVSGKHSVSLSAWSWFIERDRSSFSVLNFGELSHLTRDLSQAEKKINVIAI